MKPTYELGQRVEVPRANVGCERRIVIGIRLEGDHTAPRLLYLTGSESEQYGLGDGRWLDESRLRAAEPAPKKTGSAKTLRDAERKSE